MRVGPLEAPQILRIKESLDAGPRVEATRTDEGSVIGIHAVGAIAAMAQRMRQSALDTLDAPYLPLLLLEAAGVPLDPSFEEQKRILQRCNGLFYACKEGAEASRFNRLLIDAGLINGL